MPKKTFLICLLLLCSSGVFAQFPKAALLVLNRDYEGAKNYYLKVLEKDSMNFAANQELGLLLVQYFDDKGEALFYLNRALRNISKKELLPEIYLGFAEALHFDEQYKDAIYYYEKALPIMKNDGNGTKMKNKTQRTIECCRYAIKNPANRASKNYHVKNLASLNTAYPEFLPVSDAENTTLLYATTRDIILGDKKDASSRQAYGDVYIATGASGKFEIGSPFNKQTYPVKFMESSMDKDAIVSLSGNGKHMLLYRGGQLYACELKDGSWIAPQRLPDLINASLKFDGHACITNNGRIIYLSAVKAGGYGGKDLYRSILDENGQWTQPETLGEDINSSEDEDAPFLNAAENTLYYSSDGLSGYGGFDVFKAKITTSMVGKPENMGTPFNSPADDIYFSVNAAGTEGYLSSARKGGYGDLDLHHVIFFGKPAANCQALAKATEDVNINFQFRDSVFVNDTVSFTAMVGAVKGALLVNYFWKINDTLLVSDTSRFVRKVTHEGKYAVTLQAATYSDNEDARKDYCVTSELHVFNPKAVDVFYEPLVKKDENKITINGTVDVTKMRIDSSKKNILNIKLEPVFYSTNKFELSKEAVSTLKANIAKMKIDPAIVVKLIAHTDPRATKEYNLKLSQKRASSVVAFLEKNGIKKSRIIAVMALGEEGADTKACNNDAACLEKIYEKNRRVDIKIIGSEFAAPKTIATAKKTAKKTATSNTRKK